MYNDAEDQHCDVCEVFAVQTLPQTNYPD